MHSRSAGGTLTLAGPIACFQPPVQRNADRTMVYWVEKKQNGVKGTAAGAGGGCSDIWRGGRVAAGCCQFAPAASPALLGPAAACHQQLLKPECRCAGSSHHQQTASCYSSAPRSKHPIFAPLSLDQLPPVVLSSAKLLASDRAHLAPQPFGAHSRPSPSNLSAPR